MLRKLAVAIVVVGCNEPRTPVADPGAAAFDVEVFRWAHPPASCAMTEPAVASTTSAMLALRPGFRDCYDALKLDDPRAEGRMLLHVYAGPSGEVCVVRTKARVGLSASFQRCVENLVHRVHFEGGGRYEIPVTFEHDPPTHPADLRTLGSCARTVAEPTDATIAYASDAEGNVDGLRVDPFHGDKDALACVAEALAPSGEKQVPNQRFVAHVRMYP
jgi:hypothetical protein